MIWDDNFYYFPFKISLSTAIHSGYTVYCTYRPPPSDGSPPLPSKKPFPSAGGFGRDEPPVPGEETSQDLTKMAATVHSDARSTPPAIHAQIPSQVGLRLILFSNTQTGISEARSSVHSRISAIEGVH